MAAKLIVDGIEREAAGKAHVLRLDIHTALGSAMGEKYGVEFVPTFIVFDGSGQETWRSIVLPAPGEILAALRRGSP